MEQGYEAYMIVFAVFVYVAALLIFDVAVFSGLGATWVRPDFGTVFM